MPASLLHAGRRVPVAGAPLTIGREDGNDLVIARERVSRRHAQVYAEDGGFWIADLGSRHGTFVNGERLDGGARRLENGDTVTLGDEVLRFLSGDETRAASREQAVTGTRTVAFEGGRLTIGRDERNDVVLPDPNVSRFHAELAASDGAVELIDLGSQNGTRVDGRVVGRAELRDGSEVGIGPFSLILDGQTVLARDEHGAMRLDAVGVELEIKGKRILEPTSLSIEPGEFVAFIGESGAGKTTLLKSLCGVHAPTRGSITVNGEPLASRLTDIGYVPQDDIVHRALTVREALSYAAQLRLPEDASGDEIDATVDRVLGELSLEEQAGTRVGRLSGGQRKRVGVAAELLSRPSLLFLDEPTTGLDPGLETRMMELLRELSDGGRAIVVVTHATKNLALCDRVVVMGRGGVHTFSGTPQEALAFFGAESYDRIYTQLAAKPPGEWRSRFDPGEPPPAAASGTAVPAAPGRRRRILPQARILTARYAKLFSRDRRNAALLLAQAPLLALFDVALFRSGLFERPGGDPRDAAALLFLLAITIVWIGAIDGAPEVVKERTVVERESAVGVRLSAYLGSKLALLSGLLAVQVLVYAAVIFVFQPLHLDAGAYAEVVALLLLTGFAALAMGLLVSSVVTTQEQSISLIPLAVIPQLLFAGVIVPLERMADPAQALAQVIASQWSLAALGASADMNGIIAADPEYARVNPFGSEFFDVGFVTGAAIQIAFAAFFLAAVALVLRRRLSRR